MDIPTLKRVERLDSIAYSRQLVVAATVEPDFRSEELCKAYNTMDPWRSAGCSWRVSTAGSARRLCVFPALQRTIWRSRQKTD